MKKLVFCIVVLPMVLMSCQQKLDIKSNWKEVSSRILVLREGAEFVEMWTASNEDKVSYNIQAIEDSIRAADSIAAVTAAMEKRMSHDELVRKYREDSINLVKTYQRENADNGKKDALAHLCRMFLTKDSIENWREYLKKNFDAVNKKCEEYIFELSSEDKIAFGKIYTNALIEEYNRLLNIFENGDVVDMDEYDIVEGPYEDDNIKRYKIISKNNTVEKYFVYIKKGKKQPIISLQLVNPK